MLAQNFMNAAALDIPEWEHAALIQVLGMLERGELKYADFYDDTSQPGNAFNMCTTGKKTSCGTAACIAGWVYLLEGKKSPDAGNLEENVRANVDLHNLYFPDVNSMNDIQPEHAAIALRNYLTHGAPRWQEAFPVSD